MSSNDSMSSSRLSQFGLYRTIDARTEQFLKLSRRRQLRQGCACAAVSSALTVTVVVSALLLYGWGAGPLGAARSSWLDLMNDSDSTPFDEKLKNTVHLDRAAMKLLPIFFDKLLEHDSSSPKYETKSSTELNLEKDVFSGTNILAKIPSSRLFAIQYKTYPIVYIHSPRNTDNYSKLRKTREYERIMSYVDKMINEKVNFASSRFVRNKPPIESQNLIENKITTPLLNKSSPVPKKNKTTNVSKKYTYIEVQTTTTVPNVKCNHTNMNNQNNSCKCKLQFGILLDKLIKCFQKESQGLIEQPCHSKTEKKIEKNCIQNTNRPITRPTANTKNISLMATPRPNKVIITSKERPKGLFNIPEKFLQNLFSFNQSKLKAKEFLNQLPSFYSIINKNKTTTKNINVQPKKLLSKMTTFRAPTILNATLTKYKNKYENEKFTTLATTTTSSKPTKTTYTTTPATEKIEDIFQEILFPEGDIFELTTSRPKSLKKDSVNFSSQNHYEISTEKHSFKHYDDVRSINISDKLNIIKPSYTPKYPKIFPEEIVFEMFRKKHEKMLKEKESRDHKSKDKKYLKDSNKNIIGKLKEPISTKQMHPQGKEFYQNSSPQNKNSKPLLKFNEDMQLNLKKQSQYETVTEAKRDVHVPEIITTTTTTTATLPSSSLKTLLTSDTPIQKLSDSQPTPEITQITTETSVTPILTSPTPDVTSIPTQLLKYSHDQPIPEITTLTEEEEKKPVTISPKLESRNLFVTEDWNEFETDKPSPAENLEQNIFELISTKANSNITDISTTDETKMEITNKIYENAIKASPRPSTSLDEHGSWEGIQIAENPVSYKSIPIGRRSYLEISRGDWKQSVPRFNVDNVYDAFDELEE